MSVSCVAMESLLVINPNPNSGSLLLKNKKALPFSCFSQTPRFNPLVRNHSYQLSIVTKSVSANGLQLGIHSRDQCSSCTRPMVAFAVSEGDSNHPEIEVEKEKDDFKLGDEGSEEAWKQALDTFKEQALKIQSISQEAYEVYSKKALVILKETTGQLKIHADKATNDLSAIGKEISEEGREYITTATENSPEEIKEIVETFTSSTSDLSEISKVEDFYLGIPYGLVLSLGGFLSFMVTGSTAAIRFGVILGGTLLALSVSSLRSHRRGKSYSLPLRGQAVIATIIFLRELRVLSHRVSLISFLTTSISGAMVAFYVYRITRKDRHDLQG